MGNAISLYIIVHCAGMVFVLFFSMARESLLSGMFSRIHPKFYTPYLSSIIIGIVVSLVAFSYDDIVCPKV